MAEIIKQANINEQSREDMQRYAIYVARNRSIPEYRDGLKPVQRRIIWTMYHDTKSINNTTKSSKIVGDVMGKYHPHGDTAIYGAMKTITNWFEIYMPLITKQGNFGNFHGDGASASRYTEAKLSPFAVDCVVSELKETDKVVDWDDNYDNTTVEPGYLPSALPLLLINGASGIACGMKVEIPAHNINEVIDAAIEILHNPSADIVLVPDTCMPCEIIDSDWRALTNTGNGSFKVRGIIDISEHDGYPALIIRSIPDSTYLGTITEKIDNFPVPQD